MRAHFLDDRSEVAIPVLHDEGIHVERWPLDPDAHRARLAALKEANGYVHDDVVALTPETPELDAICAKFLEEHRHDEDEVRFVLAGEGVFDVRTRDDRWLRIEVEAGDLIVVPKDRHHRFFLTERRSIRCLRLFRDPSGWVPRYREA